MKLHSLITLASALGLLATAGCKKSKPDPEPPSVQTRTVKGWFLDGQRKPITGIKIMVSICKANGTPELDCQELGSALTGADGSFSITFQQKDTINTPVVRVEKTDSILHPNYVFFLKQGKIDDVTFLGEKYTPRRVRIIVKKNESNQLRLKFGEFPLFHPTLKGGPADTTVTLYGPQSGYGKVIWVAAPEPGTAKYRGRKVSVFFYPNDTLREEIEGMLQEPYLMDYP